MDDDNLHQFNNFHNVPFLYKLQQKRKTAHINSILSLANYINPNLFLKTKL